MKIKLSLLIILLIATLFLIKSFPVHSVQKLNTTAEVPHNRTIIVDKNLKIISIFSNTTKDVVPNVRLETEKGDVIALTDTVSKQYKTLKPSINFSKIGKVYDRNAVTIYGIKLPDKISNLVNFIKQFFLVKYW